ncbi:MAG: hydrogenase iron-sulfur subunit, partial [Gammaproteobacteria bacterium]|nr:hydrogenase iron-sulfur subunit [Gammaproteobacteria bacterium]
MKHIHSLFKQVYLYLEKWFNFSNSPAWNPLYHVGTLSFFFFWVVLISGLYLFIFFNSSIQGAYESVEYLTNEQWYLGGVMRSLHRYASDAAVVTIFLHMFREFSLDRYRGIRWYSWFTGVPTLWMVVLFGITGYWLVWDQLAQYVAISSARLLDTLPVLGGSMSTNFMEGNLSDRFFTLMGFLHLLGQPVALVFMLWFHVRRLSNVDIIPPRGLAIGSFVALLALSLAKPAVSHAQADLTIMPAVLNLDWFYLNIYPLLDSWTGGQIWLLTIGITILLMLLPWLPPKKTGQAAEVNLNHCNGCGQCFDDCPYDAITLQARTDGARWDYEVVVQPALCAACGICPGSCPSSNPLRRSGDRLNTGIDMPQYPVHELRERVDTALAGLKGDNRILAFICDHSVEVKSDLGQNTATVALLCSGMVPPTFIDYALKKGADGVFITTCRTDDCFFRFGNT